MSPLTIRVDDATRRALEELAASRGSNISDLLRLQIDSLLGREAGGGGGGAPAGLTKTQRQLFVQNHEILAKLSDDTHDAQRHMSLAEVLRKGFTLEYESEFADIHDELSPENCRTVMNILDMFRVCGFSIERLSDPERSELGDEAIADLTFRGFDCNDELEFHMLSYVRYLVATDRWQEVADLIDDKHDDGNSHCPMLNSYQRMVRTYQAVLHERRARGGGFSRVYDLPLADLQKIAKSA